MQGILTSGGAPPAGFSSGGGHETPMPTFHVVRCATCEAFMVVQQTQKPSWKCVLCGQKQSYTQYCLRDQLRCRPVV